MYCTNCKKELGNEYVLCPDCGTTLKVIIEKTKIQEEQTKQEETNNDVNKQYQASLRQEVLQTKIENKWSTYLAFSIFSLLCCNQISGIIGIIFATLANGDYNTGNYIEYNKKIKIAKWTLIGGAIFTFLMIIVIGIVNLIGIGAAITSQPNTY